MAPPPLDGKENKLIPENQTTPETALSTTEPSHYVCWLAQRLTVNKGTKPITTRKTQISAGKVLKRRKQTVLNMTDMPGPQHKPSLMSHRLTQMSTWPGLLLGLHFHRARRSLLLPSSSAQPSTWECSPALHCKHRNCPTAALTWAAARTQQWQCFSYSQLLRERIRNNYMLLQEK